MRLIFILLIIAALLLYLEFDTIRSEGIKGLEMIKCMSVQGINPRLVDSCELIK